MFVLFFAGEKDDDRKTNSSIALRQSLDFNVVDATSLLD